MRPHWTCKRTCVNLRRCRCYFKVEKCNFFTVAIFYLDHVVRPCRLELVTHTTDVIKGLKPPTNIIELCSHFWMCDYFFWIMQNFARTAASLSQKLVMDKPTHFAALSVNELEVRHKQQDKLFYAMDTRTIISWKSLHLRYWRLQRPSWVCTVTKRHDVTTSRYYTGLDLKSEPSRLTTQQSANIWRWSAPCWCYANPSRSKELTFCLNKFWTLLTQPTVWYIRVSASSILNLM